GNDKKAVTAQLEKAKAEAATAEAETLGETQSLIDLMAAAEGDELLSLRTKIKARLAQLVSEVRVLIIQKAMKGRKRKWSRERLCVLQVRFKNSDHVRSLIILHRPQPNGVSKLPGGWWARSHAVLQDFDLRIPEHVNDLTAQLEALDLGQFTAA